ncbi:uncharacterized protein LOC113382816 [Ctenocephalides felis]|uniref:uncharacterized protein LOC113382816 n=1 Tax=Ctenocephalides felis TaxID=7515 RepID=UPI000E6E25C6|nr:uncharacterized protein LOC113382816 [Ctenocephalides felis]
MSIDQTLTSVPFMKTFLSLVDNDDSSDSSLTDSRDSEEAMERWMAILQGREIPMEYWDSYIKKSKKLSRFESFLISCIFENTMDKLLCMGKNDLKPRPPLYNINEPSRIATYSRHKHKYDRNTLKEKHTELMRYERAKLESDRNFITQGMEDTLADLNQSQTFTPMQAYLRFFKSRVNERKTVLNESRDLQGLLKVQYHILNIEKYFGTLSKGARDNNEERAKSQILDSQVFANIQKRLVDKYESARREQNQIKLKQTEMNLEQSAQSNKKNIMLENRVDSEIIEFLQRQTTDLQNQVRDWSDRYDSDVEEYDTMILMRKEKLEALQKELTTLRAIYNEKQEQIEEYLEIKHERKFLQKKTLMTLLIQTWWRGNLFRKKLMPKKARANKKKKADK